MALFEKHFGKASILEHAEHGTLIRYSTFRKFLHSHSTAQDITKYKKGNIDRYLTRVPTSLISIDDVVNGNSEQWVLAKAILQYVMNFSSTIAVCDKLADEVTSILCCPSYANLAPEKSMPDSILDIYRLVATTQFRDRALEEIYFNHVSLDGSRMPTLYKDHSAHFTEFEWRKIMYFEHHYALANGTEPEDSPDAEMRKRYKFLQQLKTGIELQKELIESLKQAMRTRHVRREAASSKSQMQIKGHYIHRYEALDEGLKTELSQYFPALSKKNVIVLPGIDWNSVEVCMEEIDSSDAEYTNLYIVINSWLTKKHSLVCPRLLVIKQQIFQNYYRREIKQFARLILADDIKMKRIAITVPSCPSIHDEHTEEPGDISLRCETCFKSSLHNPLDLDTFDLLQEWVLDVPLIFQLIFESSINARSTQRSKEIQSLIQPKIYKCYMCFDILLHNLNKMYAGVLQEGNTLELSMHSKCLQSVFQIASDSGVAMSLSSAKKLLDRNAIDDVVYYNTYLKEYQLCYSACGVKSDHHVALRQCIVILMLDNLVRLKFRDDPNPGENRSKQLNTLPITLQGVPIDSDEVQSWHTAACNGLEPCDCKADVEIPQDELFPLMTTLLLEEEDAAKRFSQLSTWGHSGVWEQLIKANFIDKFDMPPDSESPPTIQGSDEDSDSSYIRVTPGTPINSTSLAGLSLSTSLQKTPLSVEKGPLTDNCSTPLRQDGRALTYNIMSPLQGKTYTLLEEVDSPDDLQDSTCENISHTQDVTSDVCLADIIGNALRDGYGVSNDFVEENFPTMSFLDENVSQVGEESFTAINQINSDHLYSKNEPEKFGFKKHISLPLLTRHPFPATGRDDDPDKLQEIMDDVLLKMGYLDSDCSTKEKILFGPDHKIGINLLKLRKKRKEYEVFLPEFPLLHVRKHKITILFSAYKDAGLIHLLQYMRDEEEQDWHKLISAVHIDVATLQVRRLATSFHLAFLVRFIKTLPEDERRSLLLSLKDKDTNDVSNEWGGRYVEFIEQGCKINATFCLHAEMMKHLDDVVAVALAERLGGASGYNLLLSSLKSSLLFAFLNGAVAYAPFTLELILEHYQASPFHKSMKMALFSTPRPGSAVNFSGDTKREMDHLDALKGFRSGSTMESVCKRMAQIDMFQSVHQHYSKGHGVQANEEDSLGWGLKSKDWKHILRTVDVILRCGALSLTKEENPKNVYTKVPITLDPIILDSVSVPAAGLHLLKKCACSLGLLGLTMEDMQHPHNIVGPRHLVKRVVSSKSTTIRRTTIKVPVASKSKEENHEATRQAIVNKEVKQIRRLTSRMNTCQALLNDDCSKPKVAKSQTMPSALMDCLSPALERLGPHCMDDFIITNKTLGQVLQKAEKLNAQVAVVEFAGVKYRTHNVTSGKYYIDLIQDAIFQRYINLLPNIESMVICEEKYQFTPDIMKSGTREQRKNLISTSIAHLKTGEEIISDTTFAKNAAVATKEGKTLISTYLAQKAHTLKIRKDIEVIIDSEYQVEGCCCGGTDCLTFCSRYAVPIQLAFSQTNGLLQSTEMETIKQRKGEAEMSQADWVMHCSDHLGANRSVISIVTSGDIDAVVVHLLFISLRWPRQSNGSFKNPVYVLLLKPNGKVDKYNITGILSLLENSTKDRHIGVKVAAGLCIGGNDFLPKYNFYGSHRQVLKLMMENKLFNEKMILVSGENQVLVDEDLYVQFVKKLYHQKLDTMSMTFDEARKLTIVAANGHFKPAEKWMPPLECIKRMAELTSVVLQYMTTAGIHEAFLPSMDHCFTQTSKGEIVFDFGPDAFQNDVDQWKKTLTGTPQKKTVYGTVKRAKRSLPLASKKRLFQTQPNT